jgi:hypothetical protein
MIQLKTSKSKGVNNSASLLFKDKRSIFTFGVLTSSAVIILTGFQVANSQSKYTTDDDLNNTSELVTELESNSSSNKEYIHIKDGSSSNSASISEDNVSIDVDKDSKANIKESNSSISVKVENKSSSSQESSQSPPQQPSIVINGQEVVLPDSGRLNQTRIDGDTKTRLRADIDGSGNSSIKISTGSNN